MLIYRDNREAQSLELEHSINLTLQAPCMLTSGGFLRFLYVLSTFDWRNNPLIVNLNQKLTAADYAELKKDFVASRESLPAMFIATPHDKTVSVWTKEAPSVQVVFRPSLEAFDVLIHLVPKQVPLLAKAVDPPLATFQQGVFKGSASTERALPIIDYDPTTLMNARKVEVHNDVVSTVPNIEAILQDFQLIGEGLVKTVELRTEKWVI
ncbi:Nucleolar protein 6 [Triplophysa tibetana]|uniref:Nucleolar protein 6 n=1 Tax=Triplophysa tibetana TaxID=1572043 RepID=A0A5A9P3Q2_9TELE|nr:Nucleolar protein 6 [Triplophysa tibetana]